MTIHLNELVAATHTPFDEQGNLNLAAVEKQAKHLLRSGVKTVFIAGSTGESHSLNIDERLALSKRWSEVIRDTPMRFIVHVGSNCLVDAKTLAVQAKEVGAAAVSSLSPSYFKPKDLNALVECCAVIAGAVPDLPFYFYDIPVMTGVHLSMPAFLEQACERIPNLAGLKFTNPDLMAYQRCLHFQSGRFDIPWGTDEYLLAALAVGAKGGVGSTYNFAAPLYHRLIAAFNKGDLATARMEQYRSVQLVDLLAGFGFMGAAKATMGFLGVDVGSPRLPHGSLSVEQRKQLRDGLEKLGFFEWVRV
jgi:N-acetylneuraminate lyase